MPTVVVGAGLAGLACAYHLQQMGIETIIVEKDTRPGGRVQTDAYEGFLLDRGFQVLQTAYPEIEQFFDLEGLQLSAFYPGAMIYRQGVFHELVDPLRCPSKFFTAVFSQVGTLRDKLLMWNLKRYVLSRTEAAIFSLPEMSTQDFLLTQWKFSREIYEQFFRPWFAGIFLEKELLSSCRLFLFYFRIFAKGNAALPAQGIQAIPNQLATKLRPGTINYNSTVKEIRDSIIYLDNGESIKADKIVLAVDQLTAKLLMGDNHQPEKSRGTSCIYFSCSAAPIKEPYLVLNGEQNGLVNNLSVLSLVTPGYAPKGQHLISVSIVGSPKDADHKLIPGVIQQLRSWFGAQVDGWQHLRTYNIPHALPSTLPAQWCTDFHAHQIKNNLYVCGDYTVMGSVQGALYSGRQAAKAIIGSM